MPTTTSALRAPLTALGITLAVLAAFGPPLLQPQSYHDFADQRALFGLPHAMDVLSNLPFLVLGLLGLARLPKVAEAWRSLVVVLCTGLLLTFAGSGLYHLAPGNTGLLLDRLGMLVLFAGILGLASADRLGLSVARGMLAWVGLGGAASLTVWWYGGNLLPWALLQAGGVLALLLLACTRPQADAPALRLGLCVAWYGLAKLCELTDDELFRLSNQMISGHSLKHLLSSLAVLPLLLPLIAQGRGRHSSASPA